MAQPATPHYAAPAAPAYSTPAIPAPAIASPRLPVAPPAPALTAPAPKGKMEGLVPILLVINIFLLLVILAAILFLAKGR
jgi:hypothetical protein